MSKKLLIIFILGMFLISSISAFEFDNVKSYDIETKTATIKNVFGLGEDLMTAKLNTEQNVIITNLGYVQVAEFEIKGLSDYLSLLKEIKTYDLQINEKEINVNFDYKIKVNESYEYESYDKNIKTGYRWSWKNVIKENINIKKGESITIGLFTNVKDGDYVEWIPNIAGVNINEWASYEGIGGSKTIYGSYTIHTFTSSGTFNWTGTTTNVSILVVGGGAGGGKGGGGAGGVNWSNSFNIPAGFYNVTVGAGGATLNNGTNSSIDVPGKLIAWGGGTTVSTNPGQPGGSGGGAGLTGAPPLTGGLGVSGQGNKGGDTDHGAPNYGAGGGGGCGAVGADTSAGGGGNGGDGCLYSIYNGTALYYAGGGGGGAAGASATAGTGGKGGGSDGEFGSGKTASNAVANTGGGGGGSDGTGGAGGSGIVIIRYLSPSNPPVINVDKPVNNTNFTTTNNVIMNATIYDDGTITNATLYIDNVGNETNSTAGVNNSVYTFEKNMGEGNFYWLIEACDNSSECSNSSARLFTVDVISPAINLTYPNQTIIFHEKNTNLSINWSANDTNIDTCLFQWNNENTTIECIDNHTTFNITSGRDKTLTLFANDTFGHVSSQNITWNYRLFLNSETYDSSAFEGTSSTFSANLLTNGSAITQANLSYDDGENLGTISNHGDNNFTITETITIPGVSENTNKSFFWNITQGTLVYNITAKNQTVNNLAIDNCTNNLNVLYNFTLQNEETQAKINNAVQNTSGRLNLQIYSFGTTALIESYNKVYLATNPFAVCLNNSLTGTQRFNLDLQLQYSGNQSSTELFHLQNETINSTSFNTNITLRLLNSSDEQIFKVIFRDSAFLPVQNALVKIYRKYVDENQYKLTEIPKTDSKGETIAHLVLNDVIYRFQVVKYGVTLLTLDNVLADCQIPLVKECIIDLNQFSDSITLPDFEEAEDFSYTLGYNNDTRVISTIFSIPSGEVTSVSLNVTSQDSLGTSVCTDSLVSSSGTLSCVVPSTFGNSTIKAEIYRGGVLQAHGGISLDQSPSDLYGVSLIALSIFIMITLIGAGISDNPVFTIIFFMVGVILLFSLNLVANNGFIGGGATILFLIVGIIIILIKAARRN